MGKVWSLFFLFWTVLAIAACVIAPRMGWWFPGPSLSPLGMQIDDLFHLILAITTITFIGTMSVLIYVLWRFGSGTSQRGWFSHGSHNLEVIWTIVPAGVLLFISLYQLDVWARFRVKKTFDPKAMARPIAEVTARQFEWRIRYPAPGKVLQSTPQPDDLYTVNDLHVPSGRPVVIQLRSEDVLHSFFLPRLRVKQDAVPGLVIPVWFEAIKSDKYELVCAELCGWGHYKMKGQVTAETVEEYDAYLKKLSQTQFDDGVHSGKEGAAPAEQARLEEKKTQNGEGES